MNYGPLLRTIDGRLPAGAYNAQDLRRWFRRLDEIMKVDPPVDYGIWARLDQLHIEVMRVASHNLPAKLVGLNRIGEFEGPKSWDGEYSDIPIVVIGNLDGGPLELADGRHRVILARAAGKTAIMAVSIGR